MGQVTSKNKPLQNLDPETIKSFTEQFKAAANGKEKITREQFIVSFLNLALKFFFFEFFEFLKFYGVFGGAQLHTEQKLKFVKFRRASLQLPLRSTEHNSMRIRENASALQLKLPISQAEQLILRFLNLEPKNHLNVFLNYSMSSLEHNSIVDLQSRRARYRTQFEFVIMQVRSTAPSPLLFKLLILQTGFPSLGDFANQFYLRLVKREPTGILHLRTLLKCVDLALGTFETQASCLKSCFGDTSDQVSSYHSSYQ